MSKINGNNDFSEFIRASEGLASADLESLKKEVARREKESNPFPLEVFHPNLGPFTSALSVQYDVPKSFVGLCLLSAYSTVVGSSYVASTNGIDTIPLSVWACMLGYSSSGKSLCMSKTLGPIFRLQARYDIEWEEKAKGVSAEKQAQLEGRNIIIKDVHLPTFTRYVLPDNPKGMLKLVDELMEWINGMNGIKGREATDEQFWLSSWNSAYYSGIRAKKERFAFRRLFIGVLGGIQPSKVKDLFSKGRDASGFIYRILFSNEEHLKVAIPESGFIMPGGYQKVHDDAMETMIRHLEVYSDRDEPRHCILDDRATAVYDAWRRKRGDAINMMQDGPDKETASGIYGKINEYAIRFAALLHLIDRAVTAPDPGTDPFAYRELISAGHVRRAIRLADYFYASATEVHRSARDSNYTPLDILQAINMMKAGRTYAEIAHTYFGLGKGRRASQAQKQKMYRLMKKWNLMYPKAFGSYSH